MKPDLLVTQIKHCDYPIFRYTIAKYRDFFGKIIIYFNENNRQPYLDHFMHMEMAAWGDIVFLDQVPIDWGTQDWRNLSTNAMLEYSSSEWVCSVEQDWFARDWDRLLQAVQDGMKTHDLIGWENEAAQYIHPSFWFIKRDVLEATRKDFSAAEGIDHFGLVTRDVRGMGRKILRTQDMGFRDLSDPANTDCFHLGGVNQNFLNGTEQGTVFHRGELFKVYSYWNIQAPVGQSMRFVDQSQHVYEQLERLYPDIDPETSEWKDFFKLW